MYGGNVLLFYRAGDERPDDGETVIDSMECKVWYAGNLGMHPRDLCLLADILEASGEVDQFQWVSALARLTEPVRSYPAHLRKIRVRWRST